MYMKKKKRETVDRDRPSEVWTTSKQQLYVDVVVLSNYWETSQNLNIIAVSMLSKKEKLPLNNLLSHQPIRGKLNGTQPIRGKPNGPTIIISNPCLDKSIIFLQSGLMAHLRCAVPLFSGIHFAC